MGACDIDCGCGCGTSGAACACDDLRGPWHPHNPSGQPSIEYRVGDFGSFRHDLVRHRDGEVALASWRPTTSGDLALQVVDWWAYVADALTFASERIANESYLGTAVLPESVARLVSVLGCRPRPGIGASATLAVLASGPDRIVLPDRFAIASRSRPGIEPQTFELTAGRAIEAPTSAPGAPDDDLTAAAPASGAPPASAKPGTAEPPAHDALLARGGVLVKGKPTSITVGSRLLLIAEPWNAADDPAAVVTVTALVPEKDPHGRVNTRVQLSGTGGISASAKARDFRLRRATAEQHLVSVPAGSAPISASTLVLDSTARTVKAGQPILLDLPGAGGGSSPGAGFDLVRCTSYAEVVWFANGIAADPTTVDPSIDAPIPLVVAKLGIAAHSGAQLVATYGSRTSEVVVRTGWTDVGTLLDTPVTKLAGLPSTLTLGRRAPTGAGVAHHAMLEDARGRGAHVLATPSTTSADVAVAPATTTAAPALEPPLRLLWDLITVTRGESVRGEPLGTGDATRPGQDFTLSRSPVTYLADGTDPADTGAPSRSGDGYSSTIELIVDGVRWTEVPMLFGRGARERVFSTYEDELGKTHVVTGDGGTGMRLTSGAVVVANYRFGSGALAPDVGTLAQVKQPVPGLAGVRNPVAASGGADPESRDTIRRYAPRSVLTFGRAVSHDDYAAVAALAPGVSRAAASWSWDPGEQRSMVRVWVGDDAGAVASARLALREQSDPNRPVVVLPAVPQPTTVRFTLRIDPAYVPADVVAAVRASVTALFAPGVLRLGEPLYRSRLEAACDVAGVKAVHGVLVGYEFDFDFFLFDLESPGPRWFSGEGGYFDLFDLDISWEVDGDA